MKAYFEKLYRYNQWANTGLCHHLKELGAAPEAVMMRLSHIVAAEEIWYDRIEPLGFDPLPVFGIQALDKLEPRLISSAQRWLDLVERTTEFELDIHYSNLSGKSFTCSLSDLLIHLANHGTHHRGQIATLLRQHGFDPLPMDYIFYSRELRD
jgi:uncharacterized damage-inducible protein DinB